MVYKFFRMQAIEDCVRVVESDYFYFDGEWKLRFPGDIPMTIPFPRKIYGNELSLIYVKGKYVLKFNPEEHLVHHIKNELLVYRHILSKEIPNTMQFVSHIEYGNHLLLLFEGLGENEFVHEYFYEIFSCLQHFHDRVRYVHRDIRPANIVFIRQEAVSYWFRLLSATSAAVSYRSWMSENFKCLWKSMGSNSRGLYGKKTSNNPERMYRRENNFVESMWVYSSLFYGEGWAFSDWRHYTRNRGFICKVYEVFGIERDSFQSNFRHY